MYSFCNFSVFLPPANVVCEGYVLTPVCDSVNGGACVVGEVVRGCSWGVHAWLLWMGVHGSSGGHACFFPGGAWFLPGGMCGFFLREGVHGFFRGGMHRIR